MAILYLLIVPVLIYVIRAFAQPNTELTKLASYSRSVFVGFILLYTLLLYMAEKNYYLIGYKSTSIVFILSTLAGITYVLADTRPILESFKRVLLNLAAFIFMACLPILIMILFADFNKDLIYADSKFRVENEFRGIMAPCGLPGLFKKEFPIERKLIPEKDTCISIHDISKVAIANKDSILTVTYFLIDREHNDSSYQMNVNYRIPAEQ